MKNLNELKDSVKDSLAIVEKKPDVKEAEIFASTAEFSLMRICFATNVPSNCIEEPKSDASFGISARIAFKDGSIGFGKSDSALDRKAASAAYEKARKNRVFDSDFKSLPSPGEKSGAKVFSDKKIFSMQPEKAVDLAYECLSGALDYLSEKGAKDNANITGELEFGSERIAVANSNGVFGFDEGSSAFASLTTILEGNEDVAGTWMDCSLSLKRLDAYGVGRTSAEKAFLLKGGSRINSGSYDVVFGSLAFADLIYSRLALNLDALDYSSTPYADDLGKKIAVDSLDISDDGNFKDAMGSCRITDEGLAAGKTDLVKEGTLVDFISNDYYAKKFSKLKKFAPKNGFRAGYSSEPGIGFTNIAVHKGGFSAEELVSEIKNGIYVGRIWYTYPLNGLSSADFTSTIRGDSFLIENGRMTKPLVPNTLRINDNFSRILQGISAIGNLQKQVLAWGESHTVITPEIAVRGVRVERIAEGLY